jgi:hypothetical protein
MRSSTSVWNEFREAELKGTITIVTNTWDDEAAVFLNVQKKSLFAFYLQMPVHPGIFVQKTQHMRSTSIDLTPVRLQIGEIPCIERCHGP